MSGYLNDEAAICLDSRPQVDELAGWAQARMSASTLFDPPPAGQVRNWAEDISVLLAPLL